MESIYLACHDHKVALKLSPEDNIAELNPSRDAFLSEHVTHNFETATEEYFRAHLLPKGIKDIEDDSLQPTMKRFGLDPAHGDYLDFSRSHSRVPPYGFPKGKVADVVDPLLRRPPWDEYFLNIADAVRMRGTCSRLQVGAVLTRRNQIISTGYNGAPPGLRHCDHREDHDMEDGHCSNAQHAERNALLTCEVAHTESICMYVTVAPCMECTRSMITFGVSRIVYRSDYRTDERVIDLCKQANIALVKWEEEE